MIAVYSILHFTVDAICAFAMFGQFGNEGVYAYLFYNLFAFVLQLPIGAVIDLVMMKLSGNIAQKRFNWAVTFLGVVFTLAGMYTGFVALGVGNALFHSGGGVSCIREDRDRGFNGRGLGVFVAPGALGLFIGKLLADYSMWKSYIQIGWIVAAGIISLIALLQLLHVEKRLPEANGNAETGRENAVSGNRKVSGSVVLFTVISCFIVVIIRSYVGLGMSFDWKVGLAISLLTVVMVALGKAAGGFVAAKIGRIRTICISLGLAGIAFYFSQMAVGGLLALFLFNMTMPITLHMMAEMLNDTPGIAFGSLSLGLFIGFLPVYFDMSIPVSGVWIGVAGSLISVSMLIGAVLVATISKRKK